MDVLVVAPPVVTREHGGTAGSVEGGGPSTRSGIEREARLGARRDRLAMPRRRAPVSGHCRDGLARLELLPGTRGPRAAPLAMRADKAEDEPAGERQRSRGGGQLVQQAFRPPLHPLQYAEAEPVTRWSRWRKRLAGLPVYSGRTSPPRSASRWLAEDGAPPMIHQLASLSSTTAPAAFRRRLRPRVANSIQRARDLGQAAPRPNSSAIPGRPRGRPARYAELRVNQLRARNVSARHDDASPSFRGRHQALESASRPERAPARPRRTSVWSLKTSASARRWRQARLQLLATAASGRVPPRGIAPPSGTP